MSDVAVDLTETGVLHNPGKWREHRGPLVTGTLWLIVLRQRFALNALKAAKSREELA